jgi:large subunit ribosomal protein L25
LLAEGSLVWYDGGNKLDKIELTVTNREILGKKVKHLRRQGITPVHLFGHGIKSLALQCETDELERVLGQAGHTGLVSLKVDHEKKSRSVVIREFDRDWRKGQLLHVDFYQVRMGEKIKVDVPIALVGEAPALESKAHTLEHELETLNVECLPSKIPSSIEVDISSLSEPDQTIRVKDVTVDKDITILNDPDLVVVKISYRHIEKIEEEVIEVEEEAAVEEGEAPEEGPSGGETEET